MLSGPRRAEVLAKTMVGQVRCPWAQPGWGVGGGHTPSGAAHVSQAASGYQDVLCLLEPEDVLEVPSSPPASVRPPRPSEWSL